MRTVRIGLVAALAAQLLVLSTGHAVAHTETISDGNDTRGPLDIRSATVSHIHGTEVDHHIETFGDWSVGTLGNDSFFVIVFDTSGTHKTFERCAFAFQTRKRLRGSLTNCGSRYITSIDVSKEGGSGVDIKVPYTRLGDSYRWAAESVYAGGSCAHPCVDVVPNTLPLPSHDIAAPTVHVSVPLLSSDVGTTASVDIGYDVSDTGGSGLNSWVVRRSTDDGATWEDLQTGTAAGPGSLPVNDLLEGTTYEVQMNAVDGQENHGIATAYVEDPWDDASADLTADYSGSWSMASAPAGSFGGTMHTATAEDATLTISMPIAAHHQVRVVWVAPGTGTWTGHISASMSGSGQARTVSATSLPDLPRQRAADLLVDPSAYLSTLTVTIAVPAGGGAVPVDALAILVAPPKAFG
jgi:hypothetical protein